MFALTLGSCKKNVLSVSDCNSLRQGLIAEDVKMVSSALKDELTFYSRENLNKLAITVSNKCNVTASEVCFNCIYTEPAQSELRVLFNQSGNSVEKIIDISYTSANQMKIVNIHNWLNGG